MELSQLNKMWKQCYKSMVAYAMQMVSRRDVAEDIVSDSFLKVYQADRIDGDGYQFLHKIVYNKCIDYMRDKKRHGDIEAVVFGDQPEIEDPPEPDYNYMYAQYITRIHEYIKRLPADRGKVFDLYIKGYRCPQIANMLGISPQTARNQKVMAKRQITEWVQNEKAPGGAKG